MINATETNLLVSWNDPTTWRSYPEGMIFGSIVVLGQILIDYLLEALFSSADRIPVTGHHLDELSNKDIGFVIFNRLITARFAFDLISYCWTGKNIVWGLENLTIWNTIVGYVAFFVVYDFFYSLFHRALHHRSIYGLIHKHHHRQCAPSRGNVDAANTHPVEYVTGEYLHLFIIWYLPLHVYTVAGILVSMGIFASLNHTRFDVRVSPPVIRYLMEYTVIAHDKHHHFITANYSQYTMLWDKAMGTFRNNAKTSANAGFSKKE
mmetsp:Transcript_17898/g.22050  ORF Transcript_17898/g.22050 Transcript_17898/m.22050 type:complete len:264 (-) Transcript_17898:878-1669(-)